MKTPAPTKTLNVLTVVDMSAYDVQRQIFPLVKVPEVSANIPADVEGELVPLLSEMANEASFLTQLFAICVSLKADMERDPGSKRTDADRLNVKAKIDILERAIKQSNKNYDSVSRIITVIMERPHSRLRREGT